MRVLILDGTKMFHRRVGKGWSVETKEFVAETKAATFDCDRSLSWNQQTLPSGKQQSFAFIYDKRFNIDSDDPQLRVLLMYYRPFAGGPGSFSPDRWSVLEANAKLGDSRCLKIRESRAGDDSHVDFWVDRDMMAVIRLENWQGKRLSAVHEIEYAKGEDGQVSPKRWTFQHPWKGELKTVNRAELSNISLDKPADATFQIELPSGTLVSDHKQKITYVLLK